MISPGDHWTRGPQSCLETGAEGAWGRLITQSTPSESAEPPGPWVISCHLTQQKCCDSKSWDSQMLQIALRSPVPCPFPESYTVGKCSEGSSILMVSSLSLVRHSPKFPHSSLGSLSLLGTQVSWLLHLGKSGSENSSGIGSPSALQGWVWAAAAHVPLSSSPKSLPQHKVSIWSESQVTA